MKLKTTLLLFIMSIFFYSCNGDKSERLTELYHLTTPQNKPEFNADNAYAQIEKQLSFGPRNPGSAGHQAALNYFNNELRKYADIVYLQEFSYPGYDEQLHLTNIVAQFNPNSTNRIFICAHWDSRPRSEQDKNPANQNLPVPGANDGASGVGVILELARILKSQPVDYGVDLILFDGEDYGKEGDINNYLLGAKYFAAQRPVDYQPHFGILLDLVGDKDAEFRMEGASMKYAGDVVEIVWNIASSLNAHAFRKVESSEIYDDHIALNMAGLKTINIIDADLIGADTPDPRRNYWHTQDDTIKNISRETLKQVGGVLTHLIYSLKFNKPAV